MYGCVRVCVCMCRNRKLKPVRTSSIFNSNFAILCDIFSFGVVKREATICKCVFYYHCFTHGICYVVSGWELFEMVIF